MDALGLAVSMAISSGLRIISAGNGIEAPDDAQLAIFCVVPMVFNTSPNEGIVQEQVYIVSKGNTCTYSTTGYNDPYKIETWTFGSTDTAGSVVYLG